MKPMFFVFSAMLMICFLLPTQSQAGWKIRGWYAPKKSVQCTMRSVVTTTQSGKSTIRTVRVCR